MEATGTIDEKRRGALLVACLAVVLLVYFLNGAWYLPLQEPDEGRYADVAAAMARTGDWVTPRLNDISYYEKPAMFFWASGVSIGILGPTETAARLPSVLSCFLTAVLVAYWGWRTSGRSAGLLAGALLATVPLYALTAHMVMVDLLLTLFTTLALYAAWKGVIQPGPEEKPERRWILAFWIATGLACLTKGPIGLALPLLSVGTTLALGRQWRRLFVFLRPDGPALFLLVALPWYLAMEHFNPGYLREFFLTQNFERLATGGPFRRNRPFWYYAPVFLAYLLPWTLFLPAAIRSTRWKAKDRSDATARLDFFLACSVGAPLVLLSTAHSMLGYYLLPLVPPFALWVARAVAARWSGGAETTEDRAWRGRFLSLAAAGVLFILVGIAAIPLGRSDITKLRSKFLRATDDPARIEYNRAMSASLQSAWPALLGAGLVTGGLLLAAAAMARSRRGLAALALIACAAGSLEATAVSVGSVVAPTHWSRTIALRARTELRPGERVLLYSDYSTAISFYLGRPVLITSATYSMFGHDVSDAEAEGRSLQERKDLLQELFVRDESLLIVADNAAVLEELRPLARGPFDILDRQGSMLLVRHRRLPRGPWMVPSPDGSGRDK